MLDVDFTKELYRVELQRRNDLLDSVNLPVGLLTGLGGVLVVMAKTYSYRTWALIPFCSCVSAGGISFAVATLALIRAYVGSAYVFIPERANRTFGNN